jgi:hypothetical protein
MRRCAGVLAAAIALIGCGDDPPPAPESAPQQRETREGPDTPRVAPVRCPPDAPPGCVSARGRVVYVEAVDADGDGDAHFVLASRQGISAPGITAVDVRRDLRPRPLPRVGDAVAAAGPVFRGSFGQRQIEAIDLRVARARR